MSAKVALTTFHPQIIKLCKKIRDTSHIYLGTWGLGNVKADRFRYHHRKYLAVGLAGFKNLGPIAEPSS